MQPIKLLVIDDEIAILELMRLVFSDPREIRLETLINPLYWREMVRSFEPDVLLVDYRMPELSGADLLRQLTPSELKAGIRGIGLFSATPLPDWEIQHLGADLFVQKPFDIDVLVAKVRQLASLRPSRRAA